MTVLRSLSSPKVHEYLIKRNGWIPNNSKVALLHYENVFNTENVTTDEVAEAFENHYVQNGWHYEWRSKVFPFHHYHSTAHEVLGMFVGTASVVFGGEGDEGVLVHVKPGDMIVIPAGVSHKAIAASEDFYCVGGYPNGTAPDMVMCKEEEFEPSVAKINGVPVPPTDPVYGSEGPLVRIWNTPIRC
eukprot:GILI01029759.1.p1 GENE.GILI01029759.1~~GILI01029759.1.p1  ORF type:complete len:206 (-),score=44.99 GILI01029759.1:47-607(-)